MFFDLTAPLSLYSIPAMFVVSFFPAFLKTVTITSTIGFDNVNPRGNVQRAADSKKLSPELAAKVRRMEAAHMNGNETLPIWIAAILAGNFVGLDHETLNKASLIFVSLRALYNWVYIQQKTEVQGFMRTAVYFAGISVPFSLLMQAGNKARLG
ncbi:hypothetical protein SERLA73DRAFT_175731 [Serpula lacrymans var. lacrymans S7.3]|uniref:Uncharacterized protein n=2 Tax=Serpula lacrymans var. lacrymans TaxID=341189 RepID=F8PL98_SERL3|nr:uncharacterized protein SERLADRAFT_458309 [Serpula lacrymans var. lacrymans S7.9]EGO04006.1 hypothetical protein SERLA73DRAFT_175731 [Serpula lacrymans var. lacrymans S7.3]EGO29926.1 hypothetical protein SERLADRAFT_458309 [Serpula lacrymans var. lacrymans S7.9]